MRRRLLHIMVGLALLTQIILPGYPAGWGIPAALAIDYVPGALANIVDVSSTNNVQASITANEVPVDPNKSITVSYTIHSRGDGPWWIQVNKKGDPVRTGRPIDSGVAQPPINTLLKKDLGEVGENNSVSGSWTFPLWYLSGANNPINPGDFEVRFYGPWEFQATMLDLPTPFTVDSQNNFYKALAFTVVTPAGVQLTCPASATGNDKVTVTWAGSITDPNASVGLFTKDSPDTSPVASGKIYGASSWTTPEASFPVNGTYNFRIFQYKYKCGTSNDLVIADTVAPTYNPTITVQPNQVSPGDALSITWSGGPPAVLSSMGGYTDEYDLYLYQYRFGGTENDQLKTIIKSNIDTHGLYQYKLNDTIAAGQYDIKIKGEFAGELWASSYFTVGASPTTTPSTTPAPQLTATAGNNGITLNWTAPSYTGKTLTGFRVHRGESSNTNFMGPVAVQTGSTYTDTIVNSGQTYYYFIEPVFSDKTLGAASNVVSATGIATPTALLTATAGDKSVVLNWTTPSYNGKTLAGFLVWRATSADGNLALLLNNSPITGSSYTDKSINNGTTYYYYLEPVFSDKNLGSQSNIASATPAATPTASGLKLTAAAGDNGIILNWIAPSYNGQTVIGFYPYCGTTAGGELAQPISDFPVTGSSYTDTNVTSGTTYYYFVKPVFSDKTLGMASNEASATPTAAAAASVLKLTATGGDNSVILNWTAPSYPGKTVIGYYPYSGATAGGELPQPISDFPVTGNTYTDENVSNGTTYYYFVKPVFSDKTQGTSSNEAFATPGVSSAATTIVLQVGSTTMTVNGKTSQLDAAPEIKYSRVFLPIRAIIEAMGGTVAWDAATQKVTIKSGANSIDLWIGQQTAQVNGQAKAMGVAPYISDSGRTMLPLRFVAENLGCQVDWDGSTSSITITYKPGLGVAGGGAAS